MDNAWILALQRKDPWEAEAEEEGEQGVAEGMAPEAEGVQEALVLLAEGKALPAIEVSIRHATQ